MASYNIPSTPQINDLQEFKSVITANEDLAMASKFAVFIQGVNSSISKDLIYLCESAEHPGRTFNAEEVRYYGPAFKLPVQTVYMDVNLTFIVRDRMQEKEFFDKWIDYINPKSSYNFRYNRGEGGYSTRVDIYQFSHTGDENNKLKATYKSTLEYAYPLFVNALPSNWAEDNYHRLQVTFAYHYWTTIPEQQELTNAKVFEGTAQAVPSTSWHAIPPKVR